MNEDEALAEACGAFSLSNVWPIARGGQKLVCEALVGGTAVILKLVWFDSAGDPNGPERCRREVELLRGIDSPHVVKVHSDVLFMGQDSAAAWLEERLDGADAKDLFGAKWSWPEVRELLVGVGAGLSAMHQQGYVHRDLSAGNVRRTSCGTWKILDPGFAKHLNRSSITGLWQPGTPGFMSPEHVSLGARVTPASDIFCLGVLCFMALTGEYPVRPEGDPAQYRQALCQVDLPSIGAFRPDLPPKIVAVLDTCLARQPARRYLDGSELLSGILAEGI